MAVAVALFSSVEVAAKGLGGAVPPLRLAFIRFFSTGLVLTPVAFILWRRAGRRITLRDGVILGGLGLIGVTITIGLFHLAILYLQANVAAIVFSVHPVFVALLAPTLLPESLSRRTLVAAMVGALGVAAFVADAGGVSVHATTGVLLMLGSVLGFALYTIMVKRCAPVYGAIEITGVASLLGGVLLWPLSVWREGLRWAPLTLPQVAATVYLSSMTTALAYVLYFLGLRRVDASQGAIFFFVKPVLASLLAWGILGERLTMWMFVGAALILLSMVLSLAQGAGASDRSKKETTRV